MMSSIGLKEIQADLQAEMRIVGEREKLFVGRIRFPPGQILPVVSPHQTSSGTAEEKPSTNSP